MPDSLKGKKMGPFVIEEPLGRGAMATVYKAFEPSINRYVALKVIELDEIQQDEFKKRFAREAEVIAKLEHIHILPIYAYGLDDEMAYLAMRWLKGGSLSDMLKRGPITLDQTVNIFGQVALGLAFAHSKGIIHRDLKPSNIMLDDGGNAYLTDFGLAKLTEQSGEITRSGTIVGTPAYMSPEQLRGEPLDHRSDIYSLGVILYNMVAGRLPFDTTTSDLVSIIYQHLEKPPTPPSEFNPNTPKAVEDVILKALQKDRKDRFSNATEMARALNIAVGKPAGSSTNLLPATPINFSGSHISSTLSAKQFTKRNWAFLTMGAIIVGLVLIVMAAFIQSKAAEQISANATQTAMAAAFVPTTTPVPTVTPFVVQMGKVLVGKTTESKDIIPREDQINSAIVSMGKDGFLAFVACTQDSEFHAGMARELADLAKRYGMPYKMYDSQADSYREVAQFDIARAQGATGMIVCPLDINLLKDGINAAHKANVPLVFQATNLKNTGGVMVGGGNYSLGLAPGRFAGKIIHNEMNGQANVIILDYPDMADIVERANGLEDGLKEFAPNATVVGRFKGATREFGKESVAKLLKDGVKFNFILSINDAGSFGAIDALEEAGVDPSAVTIVSIDAEALAQEYIRKGYFIRGSVRSAREELADAMFDAIVQLLSGHDMPENVNVPPKQIVTKETLAIEDSIIATPTS